MDQSGHILDTASDTACRSIVRRLTERHGWALLSEDELVEAVGSPTATPIEIERAAKHAYCVVLYDACRQSNDLERRERAFTELYRYLYRVAYNRWPELAEDVTQRALVPVFEQIDRCRAADTFLAFSLFKLRHAAQQELHMRRREVSLEDAHTHPHVQNQPSVGANIDLQESLQKVQNAINRLPDERQRQTILLKYVQEWSDEQIAERLGSTPNHVRVLRHRAMARLRKDNDLRIGGAL